MEKQSVWVVESASIQHMEENQPEELEKIYNTLLDLLTAR